MLGALYELCGSMHLLYFYIILKNTYAASLISNLIKEHLKVCNEVKK